MKLCRKNKPKHDCINVNEVDTIIKPKSAIGIMCDSFNKSILLMKVLNKMGYIWNNGTSLLRDGEPVLRYPYDNIEFIVITNLNKDDIDGVATIVNYDKSIMQTSLNARIVNIKHYYLNDNLNLY